MAVGQKHDEIVRLLVEAGANMDIADNDGDTPLHRAAIQGKDKVVSLLLEAGAEKDIKNNNGANLSASYFAGGLG